MLSSGKYCIHSQLIVNFTETLNQLNIKGTGYLLNFMSDVGKLIFRDSDTVINKVYAQINKKSVVGKAFRIKLLILNVFTTIIITGYYLRRLLLSFDKLTFSEVTSVMGAFQRYYLETYNENVSTDTRHELFHPDDW